MHFFSVNLGFFRVILVLVISFLFLAFHVHLSISSSGITADRKADTTIYDWYDRSAKIGESTGHSFGNESLHEIALSTLDAIFGKNNTMTNRMECPRLDEATYRSLKPGLRDSTDTKIEYFFAINLHQCVEVLPSLLSAVTKAIRFLGPHRCALSIIEGRSNDGTRETLQLLRSDIEDMRAKYYLDRNDIDPLAEATNRIEALARLRNHALKPLTDKPHEYSKDAVIIFLNDIIPCAEDLLELILQQKQQQAHMVCAMDWTFVGKDPTFYDVWIARGLTGDTFFEVPEDGNWNSAWNLFWNDDAARADLHARRPFQVFACWNGATVFTAAPFLNNQIRFRHSSPGECLQGEPQLFCKDMWHANYGRIAVVPSVNLEYNVKAARKIKAQKGFVSTWRQKNANEQDSYRIQWRRSPPELIKCAPSWNRQSWAPWDEGLADHVG